MGGNRERVVDPELALLALSEGNNLFTSREREVLTAALSGISHAEIAALLSVSEETVRNHLSAAMGETGNAQPNGGRTPGGTKGTVETTLLFFPRCPSYFQIAYRAGC